MGGLSVLGGFGFWRQRFKDLGLRVYDVGRKRRGLTFNSIGDKTVDDINPALP